DCAPPSLSYPTGRRWSFVQPLAVQCRTLPRTILPCGSSGPPRQDASPLARGWRRLADPHHPAVAAARALLHVPGPVDRADDHEVAASRQPVAEAERRPPATAAAGAQPDGPPAGAERAEAAAAREPAAAARHPGEGDLGAAQTAPRVAAAAVGGCAAHAHEPTGPGEPERLSGEPRA